MLDSTPVPDIAEAPLPALGEQEAPLPTHTPTCQFALTVVVPVIPEKLAPLRDLLKDIAGETTATMRGHRPPNPILPFWRVEGVHYARLVLLERAGCGTLLVLSTNYDGPEGDSHCGERRARRQHLDELSSHLGRGLDRIFRHCRGYIKTRRVRYLERHRVRASTFYVGAPGRSCRQIRWEAGLRERVADVLDTPGLGQHPEEVREQVRKDIATDYPAVPPFAPQPDLEAQITAWKRRWAVIGLAALAACGWFAFTTLPQAWSLGWRIAMAGAAVSFFLVAMAALLIGRFLYLERTDPQLEPRNNSETHERFATASVDENEFLQNQLTHLVRIKPGPLRWLLIRAVFHILQVLATLRYNKGRLGDIPSIHFARWVLLPNRGVLFFSNFDNSWQSYLGDFIDRASGGLTAVWSNTVGYPRSTWLVAAGSRDASRFLAWTRRHQHPTQVWYAAYPGLSISTINANTEIRRGLAEQTTLDAATWLFHARGVDRVRVDQAFSEEQTREPPLQLEQIQGIILRGYGEMPEARFLLFQVETATPELRAWLASLAVTSAAETEKERPTEPLLNIAFTYEGMRRLGLDQALCDAFSTAFVKGPADEYRARVNGDIGASAPKRWEWGNADRPVHVALLIYAGTRPSLARLVQEYRSAASSRGLHLVADLEGTTLADRKEHFGFRDGIAQPVVRGSGRPEVAGNTIAAGELLLGHRDGYGNVSHSPVSPTGFAFGYNGSYLVLRQLEQDVVSFWDYCTRPGTLSSIAAASKMVGRWPSGASLVRHPHDDPNSPRFADEDDFCYLSNDAENDRYGARCPFGAHIRRSNPRDWLIGSSREESVTLSNLHRIVRRGRPYGPPIAASMAAGDILEAVSDERTAMETAMDKPQRGLQFLCFNSNIDRQFEFVQQQWCNNASFGGQVSSPDPLMGLQAAPASLGIAAPSFTVQTDVNTGLTPRYTNMQSFVRVVGAAYLFMPSLPALRLLDGALASPGPSDALEDVPPDEQIHIESLLDALREKMKRDYAVSTTLRDAHPKMHGCVAATFEVEPDLEPDLAVGLFAKPRRYAAWVRFSNQDGKVSHDNKADIRGVAIKLMDIDGPKLLEGEESGRTHDFVLISHDAFVTKDVAEFDALIAALIRGRMPLARFLLRHPRVAWNLWRSLERHTDLLAIRYFSAVPYLLGDRAVKYSLRAPEPPPPTDPLSSPDALRVALCRRLAAGRPEVRLDFMVQAAPRGTPAEVENPSLAWREKDSPFRKVATLEIPAQAFDTPPRRRFGENLSFNPWRCLPEHRPLGGINRARRQIYRALAAFRRDRNAVPRVEPDPSLRD